MLHYEATLATITNGILRPSFAAEMVHNRLPGKGGSPKLMNGPVDVRDCLNLDSPLIERGEGETLPDTVSARRYRLCNDAAVLSNAPLVVAMPAQQWSYGLLLPLHHAVLPQGVTDVTVRLTLSVRNGSIGVAGVDAKLTRLTTVEKIVGGGDTVVSLTISNVKDTHAIVLRTISGEGMRPEVTILRIATCRDGDARLSARQHDLGNDLFVVLSMQKTATQTVEQSLLSCHPAVQVRRTHYISSSSIRATREMAQSKYYSDAYRESLLFQAECAEKFAQEIACVSALGGKIGVLSGVREPISRIVAAVFQAIPTIIPGFSIFQKTSADKLIELFVRHITHRLESMAAQDSTILPWEKFNSFFQDEFAPVAGIDVLNVSFDRDRGFTLIANGNRSILLYRIEDVNSNLASALAALTGRESIELVDANRSAEKNYAEFYKTFLAKFKVPRDICAAIYDDAYVRHFYSEDEIEAFKTKWQAD